MVKAEDIRGGYGYKKEKPYNSILPYLRSKAVQEQEEHKKPAIKMVRKSEKAEEPDYTLNGYDKARQEILAEE